MTVQDVQTLINSMGFPIVMSIGLLYYMYTSEDRHKSEIDGLKESLNQNSIVLEQLKQIISDFLRQEVNDNGKDRSSGE